MPKMAIQGLGWFLRRAAQAPQLGWFYRDALHLPLLRSWERADSAGAMLYAGDVAVYTVNIGGQPPVADPIRAECTPVFRVRNMSEATADVRAAGGWAVGEEKACDGVTVFMSDPKGYVFGLREADDASTSVADVEAARRWAAGERGLPGLEPLPEKIQGLAAVRLRVEDPEALTRFYSEMLGLDVIGTPTAECGQLHLGGPTALELKAGGKRRTPPKDRSEVPDVWILRVYDYVGIKAHLAVSGVPLVQNLELTGGWVDYYADPEGHLFGIQERKAPDPDVAATTLPEDIAARKRWESKV